MKILFHPLALLLGISLLLGTEFSPNSIPDAPPANQSTNSTLLGQGTDIASAMTDAGLDMSALPPLAWRCIATTTKPSIEIKQSFHAGGLLVYDLNGSIQVYNVSPGALIAHTFNLSGAGPHELKIHMCTDDIKEIEAIDQDLTELQVEGLSGLESLKVPVNKIDGTVSLMGCSSLQYVHLAVNEIDNLVIDPSANAYPGLTEIRAYENQITNNQDLTGCPNLVICMYSQNQYGDAVSNSFSTLNVNGLKKLKNLIAANIGISNAQDLTGCEELEYCYLSWNNLIPSLNVKGLDMLKGLEVQGNIISGTVNLTGCNLLEIVRVDINAIDALVIDNNTNAYPNLTSLRAESNKIRNNQDLTGCPNLEYCSYSNHLGGSSNSHNNQFDILLVENLQFLKTLVAANCGIINGQNLGNCGALEVCYLQNNQISGLEVDGLANLIILEVQSNIIVGEVDLTACTSLQRVRVDNNHINSLVFNPALNSYPALTYLRAHDNYIQNDQDLRGCPALVTCMYSRLHNPETNSFSKLFVDGLQNLDELSAPYIGIENDINLIGCTKLKTCNLNNNNISSISMTGLELLETMHLESNQLSTIDLSGCEKLNFLRVDHNQLTSINLPNESTVSYQIPFSYIRINENELSEADMQTFMENFQSHTDASGTTVSGGHLNVAHATTTGSYTPQTQVILTYFTNNGWTVID